MLDLDELFDAAIFEEEFCENLCCEEFDCGDELCLEECLGIA